MTDEIQAIEALQDNEPLKQHRSQWGEVWLQFRQHKGAMVGGSFLSGGGNLFYASLFKEQDLYHASVFKNEVQ